MEQVVQEEMDEEIKKDSNFMAPIDMSYKIIGTLKDPQSQKPHYCSLDNSSWNFLQDTKCKSQLLWNDRAKVVGCC